MSVQQVFTHDHHLEDFVRKHPHAPEVMHRFITGKPLEKHEFDLVYAMGEESVKDSIYRKERQLAKDKKRRRR